MNENFFKLVPVLFFGMESRQIQTYYMYLKFSTVKDQDLQAKIE